MVVVACFNSTVYADSDERIPIDLTYEVEANEDGVTGTIVDVEINKGGNELIIPDTIDGLIITKIGTGVFMNHDYRFSMLEYIHIPDTVTEIGYKAFLFDRNVKECNIPKNLEYVEESAFEGCGFNLENYKFPSTLKYIGQRAFFGSLIRGSLDLSDTQITELTPDCFANNDITSVTLPKNVKIVDGFSNNEITEINMSDSIEVFNNDAFAFNPGPEYLDIPDGTVTIVSAFRQMSNLKYVNIPDSVKNMSGSFSESGIVEAVIPDTVTNYTGGAFRSCADLKSVTLPESYTSIIDYDFYGCTSLENVNLSSKVNYIGESAFMNCTSLTTLDISTVINISPRAFEGCTSLEKMVIPESVDYINNSIFQNTPNLKSLTIFNPNAKFYDIFGDTSRYPVNSSLIIYGYENSTAQTFAKENGIRFKLIGEEEETEGFIAQEDGWRIVNTRLGFGTQTSADEGFDLLNSALLAPFKNWSNPDLISNAKDYFQTLLNDHGGRCFGLSALAVAQYNGDVDLNRYFDRIGDNLNDFGYEDTIYFDSKNYPGYIYTLNGNTEVVNLIDKVQALQHSSKLSQAEVYKDGNTFGQLLDYLYNSKERNPILVTFSTDTSEGLMNHAVVIETSKKPEHYLETDTYFVYCYDPNTPKIENNLEGASSLYNDETPGLEIDLNNDRYRFVMNYGNGYESTAWTERDMWGGLLKSINFYDLSLLDDSFFEEEFQLDTDSISQILFSGKGISINDAETNNILFEASNLNGSKLGLYDENIECNPIYSDFDNDKLGFRFGMNTSGKTFLLQGENELINLYKDRGVFIQSDGNINIAFDDDNQSIKLISASDDSQIKVMISSRDGYKYVETDGSLDTNQELVIDLSDDDYGVKTDSDNIHSVYFENNEIINENFHNNLNSDYNNDNENNDNENNNYNDNDNENLVAQSPAISNDQDNYELKTSQDAQSVKTGDDTNLGLLCFLSMFTVTYFFIYRKRCLLSKK